MAPTDRAALVALFKATGGANWYKRQNWNTDGDLSLWYGVEVRGGRVVGLSLGDNNLRGSIPKELGDLAELQTLSLFGNELVGPIPPQLGNLNALELLDLSPNELDGPIPPELGKLAALVRVYLGGNKLSGPIPPELGNLAALHTLSLRENQLSGEIPKELGDLENLQSLGLQGNFLSGAIPRELGKLVALTELLLHNNGLTGTLITLTTLGLTENQLTEVPPEVLQLCQGILRETGWNDNPWSRPPSTILGSGYRTALGWWDDVNRFGAGKSNKLKMVLVGLAEAGKTTLVRHLTGGSAPEPPDRTVGVEITPDWEPLGGAPLQVSIWDFAGQADYYSSHQLFLTKGALFLLVVDLRAFSEEMLESGVDNFTDPRGRIYWWLEMLHMRVPGAAIALVGTHVDQMERSDAFQATIDLRTVVRNFILHKERSASKRQRTRGIDTGCTNVTEEDHLPAGAKEHTRGGSSAPRSSSGKFNSKPLILHDLVFEVSLADWSVSPLRRWLVKAASGQECPGEFDFPAVNQTVSQAWIEAYDAMDALKGTAPFVLWSKAVEEYSKRMGGRFSDPGDAGKVLLRAMRHREAEGGVLLSLVNASAPVATDMLHLDPSWLIELVRRLVDHNLVDKAKRGTLEQGLRAYAKQYDLEAEPLFDMQRAYCKSGHLNKAYLRFLWMHRKMDPPTTPVVMTDSEFESIVLMMTRLLVMYTCPGADNLVVPVRLQKYGDQGLLAPGIMEESVLKVQCSFGQQYPPPGIVGRFLAWSTERIEDFGHCWLHGALFSYSYQSRQCKVFVYESEYEEFHEDGTTSKFAGLTLGVEGSPDHAPKILRDMKASLKKLVSDSAYGYPGMANLMYFGSEETTRSTHLRDLRALLDNFGDLVLRVEAAAGSLEDTAKMLAGVVGRLLEQPMLAAGNRPSEYPHLVLLRPEQAAEEIEDSAPHERIQRSGWDRWIQALTSLADVGLHHKFRLHFLCEHDLSEVPCGPDERGFPVEHLKDWVKQCVPLMQVSLWLLRVGVGVVSNVDLPLNDVLDAFAEATGAELLDSMSKVPDTISADSLPVFGEGANEADAEEFKYLHGNAFEALCTFLREMESPRQRWSGCIPCGGSRPPTGGDWRERMDQVKNPRTGRYAWVLKANKEAFLRDDGRAMAAARGPHS